MYKDVYLFTWRLARFWFQSSFELAVNANSYGVYFFKEPQLFGNLCLYAFLFTDWLSKGVSPLAALKRR